MSASWHRTGPLVVALASAAVCAVLVSAGSPGGERTAAAPVLGEIAALAAPMAADAPRFSVEPPTAPARWPWHIARWSRRRGSDDADARAALAAKVARLAVAGDNPDAMHAAALIDLRWGDTTARARTRAVEQLTRAASVAPQSSAILADLSAAYLLQAAYSAGGRALLAATEAADQALALDPRSPAARYNLMLALDRLGCTEQAAASARAYLAVDGESPRAAVARRAVALATALSADTPTSADDGRDPEVARRTGWDDALARWSSAITRGDSVVAAAALERARRLGVALARRGGDQSLADAVAAIDSARLASSVSATRTLDELAEAHRDLAEGNTLYGRGAYRDARARFAHILAQRRLPPPLHQWAHAMLGATLVHDGRPVEGAKVLEDVLTEVDARRYPAIAGRAHATLSTSLFRRGLDTTAERHAASAAVVYRAAGERDNLGSVQMLASDILLARGDRESGYSRAVDALTTLRAYPGSLWRHTMLGVLAIAALADNLPHAATRIQDEDVASAARANRPARYIEALLLRVRLESATGVRLHSTEDLSTARRIIASLPPGIERDWSDADLSLSVALDAVRTAPDEAMQQASTAVAFFGATRNFIRLVPALGARAEAHIARGHVPDALRDLSEAAALIGDRASKLGGSSQRALLLAQARRVLARAVLLQVALGRQRDALLTLERARALLASGAPPADGVDSLRRWVAPDELGVAYLHVADTLLVWTVRRGAVTLTRRTIDGAKLMATISRARALLEHQAPEARARPVMAELYDVLVRPIAADLRGARGALVLAVDGDLAAVPFAGLYDERARRYLVESHTLRFAVSLAEGAAPRELPSARDRVLLVGAPTLDPRVAVELPPLPGATAELEALRGVYPAARMLAGLGATPDSLLVALRSASVVHFAGHAVFDDTRPDNSFLALAGPAPAARLTASRLAEQPLTGVRLVVLAACKTAGGTPHTLGGIAGVAAALRAAGVGGVVASAWQVDDATTGRLMFAFHQAFRASGAGPEALRAAQRAMLASPEPFRSPSAWATFRLLGN